MRARDQAEQLLNRVQAARQGDGDKAKALQDALAAVDLLREVGGADLASALTWVGQIQRDMGRLQPALAAYEEAAQLCASSGNASREAHAARHVADIRLDSGDGPGALVWIGRVLDIYRITPPDALELANSTRILALAREANGDRAGARKAWEAAHDHYQAADPVLQRLMGYNPGVTESRRRLQNLAAS